MKIWQIKVPASTANLGPGFDSIGLALDRYLTVNASPHHKWEVKPLSPSLREFPADESNFIVQIALDTARAAGSFLTPCLLEVKSDIPLASGLGSSASAIVAGIELADVVGELGLSKRTKLELASKYEGHSDNVGASLYGGLVVTCETKQGIELLPIVDLPIGVVAVSPKVELNTEKSRAVLPDQLSFKEAVKAGAVSNMLIAALFNRKWKLVGEMMKNDLYHQPYRKNLLPHYENVGRIAEESGAFGVALSGGGPTIACLVEEDKAVHINHRIQQAFPDMIVQHLTIDQVGTTTLQIAQNTTL